MSATSSSSSPPWVAALSVAAFGANALPPWTKPQAWTPAAVYALFQSTLKLTALVGPLLFFIDAPFGRFGIPDSPLRLPGQLAFALMEIPAPLAFMLSMATPHILSHDTTLAKAGFQALLSPSMAHLQQLPVANLLLGALYVIHYTHRAVVQPLTGPSRSPSHISVLLSATIFSIANGFTLGAWLGGRSPSLLVPTNLLSAAAASKAAQPAKSASWFAGILPRPKAASSGVNSAVLPVAQAGLLPAGFKTLAHPLFLFGVAGWAVGFASNVYHDEVLFSLRRGAKQDKDGGKYGSPRNGSGEKSTTTTDTAQRYSIPQGGLYSLISYPNYFSEWFEWFSFALAALSQSPLSSLSSTGSVPLTLAGRAALLATTPPLLFALIEVCAMLPRAVRGHQWYHTKFGVEGDGKGGRYPRARKAVIPYLL